MLLNKGLRLSGSSTYITAAACDILISRLSGQGTAWAAEQGRFMQLASTATSGNKRQLPRCFPTRPCQLHCSHHGAGRSQEKGLHSSSRAPGMQARDNAAGSPVLQQMAADRELAARQTARSAGREALTSAAAQHGPTVSDHPWRVAVQVGVDSARPAPTHAASSSLSTRHFTAWYQRCETRAAGPAAAAVAPASATLPLSPA